VRADAINGKQAKREQNALAEVRDAKDVEELIEHKNSF